VFAFVGAPEDVEQVGVCGGGGGGGVAGAEGRGLAELGGLAGDVVHCEDGRLLVK
jgi:hypothetical protein